MNAEPHYVTADGGQTRVWRAGAGPALVVLPGLAVGAVVAAPRLAAICRGWSVTAIELPGGAARTHDDMCRRVAATIEALGLERPVLVAIDLATSLAGGVAQLVEPRATIFVGGDAAREWARQIPSPPPLAPRADGVHLTSLFAHLRDLDILEPSNRSRPAHAGAPYLDPNERHDSFVGWAADPLAYARMWELCVAALAEGKAGPSRAAACATIEELPGVLASIADRPPDAPPIPSTRPLPGGIWFDYADIADGRVHLRRAGPSDRRPLMMFHSAPGSSAPLSGLIEALAPNHTVIAPDYLGNGDSAKPRRKVDISLLARDALQLADRLGLESFDLWGTHTGAVVALELALLAPDRIGRAVLEAPPLLGADFSRDILANYLPPLIPDKWGLHVQQAWNMRRDMFLFWPWYRQQRDAVRPLGLPDDAMLHDWTAGLLRSGRTYDLSYRAAFEYETAKRLPLLKRPALICAGPADMLAEGLDRARALAPPQVSVSSTPATVWYPNQIPAAIAETVAIYESFLSGPDPARARR
ncbi:MAG: alpha/beta hydrolase [Xanthobacteraceae bacterium]|nr:alpha/beta hydrolase [Myxococcota bacterium]MCZ7657954.1 alpha/beta hydrolase [Xanthobacteraceae bacterium]